MLAGEGRGTPCLMPNGEITEEVALAALAWGCWSSVVDQQAGLILANRAYVDHAAPPGAPEPSQPAEGGLLAALRPVIAPWTGGQTGTTWIGASRGAYDREWSDDGGYELVPTPRGPLRHRRLFFAPDTWAAHYGSVANGFLWPLLHLVDEPLPDLTSHYPRPLLPDRDEWHAYVEVNRAFAAAAIAEQPRRRTCWIHDYQLALAPGLLRAREYDGCIGFFLHTPFPDLGLADRYLDPRGRALLGQVVAGIAGADLAGFQTPGDAERFVSAATELAGATATGDGLVIDGRLVHIGTYPVGIDPEELLEVARVAPPSPRIAAARELGIPVVVGLERADYTKGIPERLRAIAAAYRAGRRFAYVGIDAPTREGVRSYDALGPAIREAAAEAARAAKDAGMPFEQSHEIASWSEVVALQRDADVVFTSSLSDGMNLVPLQTAVVQSLRPPAERGVILAGSHAGVAGVYAGFERDGLQTIDPLDEPGTVAVLLDALDGNPGRISDRLVAAVRERDARSWATGYLRDLAHSC